MNQEPSENKLPHSPQSVGDIEVTGNENRIDLSQTNQQFILPFSAWKQANIFLKTATFVIIFIPLIGVLSTFYDKHTEYVNETLEILKSDGSDECQTNPGIKERTEYLLWTGYKKKLKQINLCNEEIPKINLSGAILYDSNFQDAKLTDANFQHSNASGADFRRAVLFGTNFKDAILVNAQFQSSELQTANLEDTELRKANFQDAFLTGTIFTESDLTDANLEGAKDLTNQQLQKAILCRTALPDDLKSLGDRDCNKSRSREVLVE